MVSVFGAEFVDCCAVFGAGGWCVAVLGGVGCGACVEHECADCGGGCDASGVVCLAHAGPLFGGALRGIVRGRGVGACRRVGTCGVFPLPCGVCVWSVVCLLFVVGVLLVVACVVCLAGRFGGFLHDAPGVFGPVFF